MNQSPRQSRRSRRRRNSHPEPTSFLHKRVTRWLGVGVLFIGLLLIVRAQFAVVMVMGDSMQPTLQSGDLLLVRKGGYRKTDPVREEMVVARFRSELVVKRVVGLPGETVAVVKGRLEVNGRPLEESHETTPGEMMIGAGTLSGDRFALLGDNRCDAEGIIFYGVFPREQIIGPVVAGLRLQRQGTKLPGLMSL